jgi:hypothetical protein
MLTFYLSDTKHNAEIYFITFILNTYLIRKTKLFRFKYKTSFTSKKTFGAGAVISANECVIEFMNRHA